MEYTHKIKKIKKYNFHMKPLFFKLQSLHKKFLFLASFHLKFLGYIFRIGKSVN